MDHDTQEAAKYICDVKCAVDSNQILQEILQVLQEPQWLGKIRLAENYRFWGYR